MRRGRGPPARVAARAPHLAGSGGFFPPSIGSLTPPLSLPSPPPGAQGQESGRRPGRRQEGQWWLCVCVCACRGRGQLPRVVGRAERPAPPSPRRRFAHLSLFSPQASSGPAKETNPLYEKRPKTFGEFYLRAGGGVGPSTAPRAAGEREPGGAPAAAGDCQQARPRRAPPSFLPASAPRAQCGPEGAGLALSRFGHGFGSDALSIAPSPSFLTLPPPLPSPPFPRRRRRAPPQAGPAPLGEVAQVRAHPAPAPGPVPAPEGERFGGGGGKQWRGAAGAAGRERVEATAPAAAPLPPDRTSPRGPCFVAGAARPPALPATLQGGRKQGRALISRPETWKTRAPVPVAAS